jgi:hemoglobin-like flavoprotein
MNKKLTDLALQVGGSHYPSVSRGYLPLTVKLVAEDAVRSLRANGYDDAAECLAQYFKTYEQQ